MADQEIRGVTYGFDGERLDPWQAVQRLYRAGFTDAKVLATGYAVMMGESGCYLKAWHHNCERDAEGNLVRDEFGNFTANSTDLGFIQRNIPHNPPKRLQDAESQAFVDSLFAARPELADGQLSANIARKLYASVGYQWTPWYAHTNGSYKRSLGPANVAVGNFLDRVLLDYDGQRIIRR